MTTVNLMSERNDSPNLTLKQKLKAILLKLKYYSVPNLKTVRDENVYCLGECEDFGFK